MNLDDITPNVRVLIVTTIIIGVIVAILTGAVRIDEDTQAILTTVVGGAILYALRAYSTSTKERVDHNTQITARTAETTNDILQVVQQNTSLRLEVEMYRKVFKRVRQLEECAICAEIIAKEFEVARRV